MATRTVEMFFEEYIERGFTRTVHDGIITYSAPASMGTGGFTLLGDTNTCYASITDITLNQDLVLVESINEKLLEFGIQHEGNAAFYKTKKELFPVDQGLNFYAHDAVLTGYLRIKANQRLFCCGLILREAFFEQLPFAIPNDFWENAIEILNPDIINFPQCFEICEEIEKCQLTGTALNHYIYGKGYEALGLILDYLQKQKNPQISSLKPSDRKTVEDAKRILLETYKTPPSIKALAKSVHINQQKLMNSFKQITGTTVYGYIKKIRMQHASILLQTTDLTIVQIAKEVGYHGDGHFQKNFHSIYKQTPNQYRKNCKVSNEKNQL